MTFENIMDTRKIQDVPPPGKTQGLSFELIPPFGTELSIHRLHEGKGFFIQFVRLSMTSIANVFYVEAKQLVFDSLKIPEFISVKGYVTREDLHILSVEDKGGL